MQELVSYASGILALALTGATGYYAVKGIQAKNLRDNQKELIDVLKMGKEEERSALKSLQKKHQDSEKQIANLQGQVDTLKTVPLKVISDEMVELKTGQGKLIEATHAILEYIKSSNNTRTEP